MPIKHDEDKVIRPGVTRHLTSEQLAEVIKCKKDIIYFAEKYYKVVSNEKGEHVIQLRDFQKRLLLHFTGNRHVVVMSGRQSGKTTCSCIYLLWMALFNEHCPIAVLANKQKNAIEIIDDIKKAYEGCPSFMKPGPIVYNATMIEFENGSKIFGAATSENALRGFSAKILFCDEFAFVPKNIAEKFWKSNFPIIGNSGKVILVSTPNGASGLYYDIWQSANKKDGNYPFAPFKVDWWEVPGRDEKFKQDMIASLGMVGWKQEYECSFEGSSKTLINGESLERLAKMMRDPIKKESEFFYIWAEPKRGRVYIAGLDVGTGSGSDNSVIAIFDVTNYYSDGFYDLVALYKRNDINVFDFAAVVDTVAKRYNYAACICENNGTGLGGILLNELYMEKGYENVFYDYDNQTLGVNANSQTKPMATTSLKEDIEANVCRTYSSTLLVELRIYEEKNSSPGKFSAKRGDGNRDDQVSASYWAAFMLRSKWWDDNKNDFYNKVIPQQANRSEEVQAEQELEDFKRIFSDGGTKTPEQEMQDFEREMQEGF